MSTDPETMAGDINDLNELLEKERAYISRLLCYITILRKGHPNPPTMEESGC